MKTERFIRDFLIFYAASLVFFAIGVITTLGLGWYNSINTPSWTPPQLLISAIWGMLFITTITSLSLYCDTQKLFTKKFGGTVLLYMGNAFLILLWNYLFFGLHTLVLALCAAVAVGISVLALILRIQKASNAAAWLLVPYFLWVVYAVAINYAVIIMN
jgi:benzodiazapine receptor